MDTLLAVGAALVGLQVVASLWPDKAARVEKERVSREGAFRQALLNSFRTGSPEWRHVKSLADAHQISRERLPGVINELLKHMVVHHHAYDPQTIDALSRYLELNRSDTLIASLPDSVAAPAQQVAARVGNDRAALNALLERHLEVHVAHQAAVQQAADASTSFSTVISWLLALAIVAFLAAAYLGVVEVTVKGG